MSHEALTPNFTKQDDEDAVAVAVADKPCICIVLVDDMIPVEAEVKTEDTDKMGVVSEKKIFSDSWAWVGLSFHAIQPNCSVSSLKRASSLGQFLGLRISLPSSPEQENNLRD